MLRPNRPALHSFSNPQYAVVVFRNGNIRRCAELGTLLENNSSPLPRFTRLEGARKKHPFTRLNTEGLGDLMLKTSLSARIGKGKITKPFIPIGAAVIMRESRPHK